MRPNMQRGGAGAAQYGRDASQYKQLRTLVVAAALRGVAGSLRARWLVGNRFWWARVERNSQGDGRPAVVVIPLCGIRVVFFGVFGNQNGFSAPCSRRFLAPPGVQPSIGQAQRSSQTRAAALHNFQSPKVARTHRSQHAARGTRTMGASMPPKHGALPALRAKRAA